jgi:aminopeptidase N
LASPAPRGLPDFGNALPAHENSHQWFGQRVGWKGYHDVWLSEGFAEFSANLYVQYREGPKEFLDRWRTDRQGLSRVDPHNHPIESLGPISLGWRVVSSESDPRAFHDLVTAKGAFVLHMLRMQLYDVSSSDPDRLFKEMMQDYCKTFDNKPASTADFKAVVERHMTPPMDLAGTHTMDWFFDQYVYGTGIPRYALKYTLENTSDGKKHLKGTITRSGVPDSWKDDLVLYGHSDGSSVRLGIVGATHPEQNIDVMLPAKFDRISINDQEDTLAEVTQ